MIHEGVPFRDVLIRLEDQDHPFPPKLLHYFSDISETDATLVADIWKKLSINRRASILYDLEELSEHDTLVDFSAIGKIALTDPDEGVRESGLRLLWECEDKPFINTVTDLVKFDPSPRVRATAASLMGHFVLMGETDALPEALSNRLVDLLFNIYMNDVDKSVRRHALESLGYSSRDEVTPLLAQAARNPDPEWVASSLYAMGRNADTAWAKTIIKHLDHVDDKVREEAVRSAGELGLSDTREILIEMLDHEENDDIRGALIWSLSQIGGDGIREAILKQAELVNDEELLDFIEDALDNLNFTEEMSRFNLFEIDNGEIDG